MLSIHKVFKTAAVAAGIVAMVGSARANTITQTFNIPTTAAPFTQGFTYALFDTNTGTLTNVTIRLQTASTAEVDVFNSTQNPQPFTNATASFPLTLTGPPANTAYVSTTIVAGPISGTANPGFNAFPGLTVNTDSGNVGISNVNWPGNYMQAGPGNSAFQIIASVGGGSFSGNADPGVFFGGSGSVGGTVTLIYTFTVGTPGAPEPGAWALLVATGSVSVLGLRRRRALKA